MSGFCGHLLYTVGGDAHIAPLVIKGGLKSEWRADVGIGPYKRRLFLKPLRCLYHFVHGALDNLILQLPRQVDEVSAVAAHADEEILVVRRAPLGVQQLLAAVNVELDVPAARAS